MTYSISASGHGDEPYEERADTEKALLAGLVKALEEHGGNVTQFNFEGNEVHAWSWSEAKALARREAPTPATAAPADTSDEPAG
jgi:hypothetical protein